MVDIIGLIPLSVGGAIGLLINVVIVAVILMLTDRFLAHEMSAKNSFIMAFIAYFVVPILLSFAAVSFPFSGYVIPLIIWIGLGEVLLKGSRKGRLTAAAVAFVVYIVLTMLGVQSLLASLIPF